MDWRPPTAEEASWFAALLREGFPGSPELARQLATAKVRPADDDGCLDIQVDADAPRAPVQHRVPVEAEAADTDGIPIHVLLHVVDGAAAELEVFKEDNSPVVRMPPTRVWIVVNLEGPQ